MSTEDRRNLALADLAAGQWGLFTSAQARAVGVSPQQLKRLADRELLQRVRHGVYQLTGTPESPHDQLRAEWLALEPARLAAERIADEKPVGVVSHRSAAHLQQLGDLDADFHEFTVPTRRSTRSPDVKFHVATLERRDWRLENGLPVTRPLRTVVDLAAARIDGGHLATVVRDAILDGDTTRDEIEKALRPYAHHYGVPLGAGHQLVENFIGQAGVPAAAEDLAATNIRRWLNTASGQLSLEEWVAKNLGERPGTGSESDPTLTVKWLHSTRFLESYTKLRNLYGSAMAQADFQRYLPISPDAGIDITLQQSGGDLHVLSVKSTAGRPSGESTGTSEEPAGQLPEKQSPPAEIPSDSMGTHAERARAADERRGEHSR